VCQSAHGGFARADDLLPLIEIEQSVILVEDVDVLLRQSVYRIVFVNDTFKIRVTLKVK
jgi:hypothetical protein